MSSVRRCGTSVADRFNGLFRLMRRSGLQPFYFKGLDGGEGEIRPPDTVARMPHFACGAFNHSATSSVCKGLQEIIMPQAQA